MSTTYEPLRLSSVKFFDEYVERAYAMMQAYLNELEPDNLVAGFLENAGLAAEGERYGGWESTLIGGHFLGHYLSALAYEYSISTALRGFRVRNRVNDIVKSLARCQKAVKSGLIWGAMPVEGGIEAQFDNVEQGKTDIRTEAWVPWYTLHKLIAGLQDVRRFGIGSAASVLRSLMEWVCKRVSRWDDATAARVRSVEYGGMNDALYLEYAVTGDPVLLKYAEKFDDEALYDEILEGRKDFLNGRHANETIPKVIGAVRRYAVLRGKKDVDQENLKRYLEIGKKFFSVVVEKHTYVTGGNSEWEHFGMDGVLDAERTNCNCESCNAYNMMKLASLLFSLTGSRVYSDYYERTFTNAVLASQDRQTGMTTYFQPMAGGFFKVYSSPYDSFWCCTGTGAESFMHLAEGIFYHTSETLFVTRYLSLDFTSMEFSGGMRAEFPYRSRVVLRAKNVSGGLNKICFFIPAWCKEGATCTRNGENIPAKRDRFYASLENEDRFELNFPPHFATEGLPDAPHTRAFLLNGVVLSAELGTEDMETVQTGVSVEIPARRILDSEEVYFKKVSDAEKNPRVYLIRDGRSYHLVGTNRRLTFSPYFQKSFGRYAIYWKFREGTPLNGETAKDPVDLVQAGYGQYESDELHALDGKDSVGVTSDGTYRYAKAGGWFSYDFAVGKGDHVLELTLRAADNGKFLVVEAGEVLFAERLLYCMGEEEYRKRVEIPAEIVERYSHDKQVNGRAKKVLTVRFSGGEEESARVCDLIKLFKK